MRIIRVAAITFTVFFLSTIGVRADGTWCAEYGSPGATNCGFYSFEQCQAALSGNRVLHAQSVFSSWRSTA